MTKDRFVRVDSNGLPEVRWRDQWIDPARYSLDGDHDVDLRDYAVFQRAAGLYARHATDLERLCGG